MKKTLFVVLAAMLMQVVAIGQLSIRPQVGVNFASFNNDLIDANWKSKVGYQFGLDLQIGGALYVQPGLNYQSSKLTFEGAEEGDLVTRRLNIPIVIGFRLFEQESQTVGIRGFAGPNMAVHLGEDVDDAITGLSSDDFKTAQFSFMVGAGVDFSILFLDVAYKFGISDFIEIEDVMEDTNQHMFFVNAGLRIGR